MHLINQSDLEKISDNIYKNLSATKNRTLTSIKECILRAIGYKNLHSFQAHNENNNSGLLNYFTNSEILKIAKINIDIGNKKYADFNCFINDVLLIIKNSKYLDENEQIKKINFLKFLNENNFTFFNYKWFKQSCLKYIDYTKNDTTKISAMYGLDFWNSIKDCEPLVTISLYKSKAYTNYFLEHQAIERKKIYTIYDFIKSSFISIKKDPLFGIALDILRTHYTLLTYISESMDRFSISNFDYQLGNEKEYGEYYFNFKQEHLNKLSKVLKKKDIFYQDIHNSLINVLNKKVSFKSSNYNFDKDIKVDYFSLRGLLKDIKNGESRNIIVDNLSENILLASKDIFKYNFENIGFEDRVFENNNPKDFIDSFIVKKVTDKEHFYNSWLSNKQFVFIYFIYFIVTKNDMKVNDFIYFCDNFITNPELINIHKPIVADILSNEYSLFLSNSFFK